MLRLIKTGKLQRFKLYNSCFSLKLLLIILIITKCSFAQAQEEHSEHHHIGISAGISKVLPEKNYLPGGHIHYSYLFKLKNIQFGIGSGIEYLFDKHHHIGADLSLSFFPTEDLEISIAPGLVFTNNLKEYATHFEVSYSFDLKNFHLGPIFETAISKDDVHLSIGLHLGIGL